MSDYNSVGWFEIPVNNMDRAKTFYEAALGISLELHDIPPNQMAWFPSKSDAKGAAGTLIKGEAYTPSEKGVIIYFTAPDIDEAMKRIEANGGKLLTPKVDIGEHGTIAHFLDTEGNRVAIHAAKS